MNLSSRLVRLLVFAFLAALCGVQAPGGQRTFVCLCSGQALATLADHCHGPHSAEDHRSQTASAHEHGRGVPDEEAHAQVSEELYGSLPPTVSAPAASAPMIALLPEFGGGAGRAAALSCHPIEVWRPPPLVVIARTVVLLI